MVGSLLGDFLNYVNELHYSINFTIELQDGDNRINFLDLTLKIVNNKLEFLKFLENQHIWDLLSIPF